MAKRVYVGVQTTLRRLGDIAVGSIVKVKENGKSVNYIIVHQGNPSTSKYDSSCNGTWLLREKIAEDRKYGPNYNDSIYYRSEIYTYLKDTYPTRYDSSVQNLIKTAKVPYFGYGIGATELTGANGLEVKAFLLSAKEIGAGYGTWAGIVKDSDEGVTLSYFISGTSAAACDLRMAYNAAGTSYGSWFTRTYFNSEDTDKVCGVSVTGTVGDMTCNYANGIRPAIIVDSNAAVNDDDLLIGTTYTTSTASVARKVKNMYVGVLTDIPIYETQTGTTNITENNIKDFFTVTNQPYYFVGSGGTFTSNNGGVNSSTAITTLTALVDMSVSFDYSYSTEKSYDKFTLKVAETTVKSAVSGVSSGSWSGSITAGQQIIFQYTKDSSSHSNNDSCTFSNMVVTGPKKVQIGTEQKSVARRIRKGYVGVGGVARPFWSGGELSYYGALNVLDYGGSLCGVSIDNYAIFAGIYYSSNDSDSDVKITYAFDKNLTKILPTTLTTTYLKTGARAGNYALYFDNGYTRMEAYDENLTKTTATSLSYERTSMSAGSIGGYALFAGGMDDESDRCSNVYAYSETLTRSSAANLPRAHSGMAKANVGDYILFGAGVYQVNSVGKSKYMYAYDSSLVCTEAYNLARQKDGVSGGTINNQYAVFAGGGTPTEYENLTEVEIYDSALTKSIGASLSTGRSGIGSVSVGNYVIFAGGSGRFSPGTTTHYNIVESYDLNLTRKTENSLSVTRKAGVTGKASIGDYALFAGGSEGPNAYNGQIKNIDVFTV